MPAGEAGQRRVKNSFVLYHDWEEPPEDPAVRMAFRFIRTALDENRVKYEARARKNRENGLLGGRPRNPVGSWESGKSGY